MWIDVRRYFDGLQVNFIALNAGGIGHRGPLKGNVDWIRRTRNLGIVPRIEEHRR